MTGPEEWQGRVMPHHPSLLLGHMAWGIPQRFTWFLIYGPSTGPIPAQSWGVRHP